MKNKTGRKIEELMKEVRRPLHLKELAKMIGKTRYACYTAIHQEEGTTFKKVDKATYYLMEDD